MIEELLRDFQAEDKHERALQSEMARFAARFGAGAMGSEIAGEIGHITASAWIVGERCKIAANGAVGLRR